MKRILLFMIVALAVGALAPTAHAGMWLYLDDLAGNTALIADEQLIAPADELVGPGFVGVIKYSQTLGVWSVQVTTGVSKPLIGPGQLDLNSILLNTTTSGGQMLIQLTDTDYSSVAAGTNMISNIGGTTVGTVQLTQIYDPDNTEFADLLGSDPDPANNVVLSTIPLGPGAFSSSLTTTVLGGTKYSLSESVLVTHTGKGVTSFDAHSIVPVPGAVLLGILGMGVAGLKLRKYA